MPESDAPFTGPSMENARRRLGELTRLFLRLGATAAWLITGGAAIGIIHTMAT